MGMLESLPYMIGGPLILSLSLATYLHTRKEPAGLFLFLLLLTWGTVFSLFPFLFFSSNYEQALFIFHIMTSLLVLIPVLYVMAIMAIVKEKNTIDLWTMTLIILSIALISIMLIVPGVIDVKSDNGIYHGIFNLQSANLTLLSSLIFILLPSAYILREGKRLEKEIRIRARGTIAAYVAADVFYVTEAYMAAFHNYDYIHLLNGLVVMCAYAIYYFSVMRRIYRGSLA